MGALEVATSPVVLEGAGGVGVVRLTRPERLDALDAATIGVLRAAVGTWVAAEDARFRMPTEVSPDHAEGVAAFRAKRRPTFTGE